MNKFIALINESNIRQLLDYLPINATNVELVDLNDNGQLIVKIVVFQNEYFMATLDDYTLRATNNRTFSPVDWSNYWLDYMKNLLSTIDAKHDSHYLDQYSNGYVSWRENEKKLLIEKISQEYDNETQKMVQLLNKKQD